MLLAPRQEVPVFQERGLDQLIEHVVNRVIDEARVERDLGAGLELAVA